jgi:hypothetical protein
VSSTPREVSAYPNKFLKLVLKNLMLCLCLKVETWSEAIDFCCCFNSSAIQYFNSLFSSRLEFHLKNHKISHLSSEYFLNISCQLHFFSKLFHSLHRSTSPHILHNRLNLLHFPIQSHQIAHLSRWQITFEQAQQFLAISPEQLMIFPELRCYFYCQVVHFPCWLSVVYVLRGFDKKI